MFIELTLANGAAVKIELDSNAAVLEYEQKPQTSYAQTPHPHQSKSHLPVIALPLAHP